MADGFLAGRVAGVVEDGQHDRRARPAAVQARAMLVAV
jgi:hypothetical protein